MFFWILMVLAVLLVVTPLLLGWDLEDRAQWMMVGASFALFPTMVVVSSWSDYSQTYAAVVAQSEVIAVYEERVTSLKATLNEINYPNKSEISLDADTPWASLVASLTQAEKDLAEAKKVRAEALRDIEAWKRGPMSGVVTFVGEPGDE
jgi:predicted ABC-type exoprotein transport system permease subunit